jgi:WxcM-like, C-terminal.
MSNPVIISGNKHQDERGILSFINDFDMEPVKRFYTIFHHDTTVVRAWQGHQVEQKWFVVLEGAFDIALVKTG